jgi:N-acetylglutamate synthase-like GNAT family acetyltransferase
VIEFRTAEPADAKAIADLHADSWQRHYRGAFTDTFLDEEAHPYLTKTWTERLQAPSPTTILAEQGGELIGLAHTILDASPTWGALLDNLHVRFGLKRQGLGTRLMARTAEAIPNTGLHLYVLAQNTSAQAFYTARGGTIIETTDVPAPGGNPAWLNGRPQCLLYTWPNPALNLAEATE